MAETPRISRREFLKIDGLRDMFRTRDPLDRAGHILKNRFDRFPDRKLHLVNPDVLKPRERPAFHSPKPEAQGVVTITNGLPTLSDAEVIVHAVAKFGKKIVAPIFFGATGAVAGFHVGVEMAGESSKDTLPTPIALVKKGKKVKKSAKYTRKEFISGMMGASAGFGLSEGLIACGVLSPDGPNFTNYDSPDYQRTTLVGHPLSEIVSSPDSQRAPHAVELIAEMQRAVQVIKPDVSLYRTFVDYNDTKNKKTGAEFEMAFVKIGTQTEHLIVNNKEQILNEDVYLVSYIGADGKPIARVAIWSEIPDQAGAKAFGLYLANSQLSLDFKNPLLEYLKKDDENKVRVGFFDTQTHELKDTASFTLNGSEDFSLPNALSIIFNPFAVPPVEAAEITPIPFTETPTTPTVITTATATAILEPPFASPTPTAIELPTGLEASLPPKDTPFVIIQPASVDARDVLMNNGMQFRLEVVTDQTVTDDDYPGQEINRLYLNDAVFKNNYGENAEQSVAHVALQTYLDLAKRTNGFIKTEVEIRKANGQEFTLDDYKQWIAEAQAGTRSWEQVEFQTFADRLDGDSGVYKIEQVTARPDSMRVVLVDATEQEIFKNIDTHLSTNLGMATHLTKDGTIEIWVLFPFQMGGGVRIGAATASYLLIAFERMGWSLDENKSGPKTSTWWATKENRYGELVNRDLGNNIWESAFAFDPPTDEPWNH